MLAFIFSASPSAAAGRDQLKEQTVVSEGSFAGHLLHDTRDFIVLHFTLCLFSTPQKSFFLFSLSDKTLTFIMVFSSTKASFHCC